MQAHDSESATTRRVSPLDGKLAEGEPYTHVKTCSSPSWGKVPSWPSSYLPRWGGGNQTPISSTVKSAVSPAVFARPRSLGRLPDRAGDSRSQPVRECRDHSILHESLNMSIRNVIPKLVGERAAGRAGGLQADWSLCVCRVRGCRLTGAVRSGSGEAPTVFEPASYRHEAFSLRSAISPHNIGSDRLADTEKSRQNRFVGYGAVFFKRTGRFF